LLEKVVQKGDKVLSLGGHIGFHILHFSKLVGNDSKVYTFEPNPVAHVFLMYNLSLNQIHNVEVYEKAAYSENKILKFAAYNDRGSNNGGSYVIEGRKITRDAQEISVQGVRIDDVLSHVNEIDILQMDIEGCEPNAVYGAKKLIERSKGLLVLQEWSVDLMKPNADIKTYIKFWRDKGYKFARITRKGLFELTDEQLLAETHIIDIVISKNLQKLQSLY
jgi:FkbM family methyltransferase